MLRHIRNPILRQYIDLADFMRLPTLFSEAEWLRAPSIEGEYRGRHVRVFGFYESELVGSREHRRMRTIPYTCIYVDCDNFYKYQLSVALGRPARKLLKKLKQLFIKDDTAIEDRLLMENYTLKTNDNYFADKILDNGFRDILLTHKKALKGDLRLDGDLIIYIERLEIDHDIKRKRIQEMLDLAVDLAENVENFTEIHRTDA